MGCGASVDSGGGGSGKLDFTGMTTLPTDAFQRSGIQELVIRQCRLFEVPTGVFELTDLITLDIAENEISRISPLIANLSGLQVKATISCCCCGSARLLDAAGCRCRQLRAAGSCGCGCWCWCWR